MNVAVILAGGLGTRVGANKPKQFVEVLGKPVIAYTIEAFEKHREVDAVEIVCIPSYIEYMNEIVDRYSFKKVKWITAGGKDFQESVLNGITNLNSVLDREDMVLVHFGASPFVEEDIISDSIKVAAEKGNAISTTPFYVLAGIKDNDRESSTWIDRDTIACMSTPHTFKYGVISDLYNEAISTGAIHEVEPHTTTLMYKMKKTIYFSKGTQANIKITTREDLDLFEGYIMMKEKRSMNNKSHI